MSHNINTFEDLACYWFVVHGTTHKSASSLKRDHGILRKYLFPVFASRFLDSIKNYEVQEWFSALKQRSSLSPKSCNDVLGLFKKILKDGVYWGFIERSPAEYIKKLKISEKEYTCWSVEDAQLYLGYWQSKNITPRIAWIVYVALYTGMRRGELLSLKWESIDLNSDMLLVKSSYCRIKKQVKQETKSKKIRYIPLSKALKKILEQLRKITGASGFVCPFIHPDLYNKEFKKSSQQAGLKLIRFHDLRHTFASNFLMGGGNIYDLQKILGHSTIQMTERYLHLVPSHLKGKTEVLGF